MMGFNLWGWVAAAFGFLGAALLFVMGQRDKAKQKAERATANAKGKHAALELERRTAEKQAAARRTSNEVKRENENRPDDKRPSGDFRR